MDWAGRPIRLVERPGGRAGLWIAMMDPNSAWGRCLEAVGLWLVGFERVIVVECDHSWCHVDIGLGPPFVFARRVLRCVRVGVLPASLWWLGFARGGA